MEDSSKFVAHHTQSRNPTLKTSFLRIKELDPAPLQPTNTRVDMFLYIILEWICRPML